MQFNCIAANFMRGGGGRGYGEGGRGEGGIKPANNFAQKSRGVPDTVEPNSAFSRMRVLFFSRR